MLTITHGYVTHFKTLLVIFCETPRICFGAIARYTLAPCVTTVPGLTSYSDSCYGVAGREKHLYIANRTG